MAPEPSDFLANAEASPLSPLHGLIRHAWTLLLPLAGVVPLGLSYLAQSKVPPPSDTETVETEAVLEEQQVAETSPTSLPPEDIIEESNLPSPEPASKLRITAIPPENLLPSAGIPVQYHDVRPGDTLSEIAEAYQVSSQVIATDNDLEREGILQAGTRLTIYSAKEPRWPQAPTPPDKTEPARTRTITLTPAPTPTFPEQLPAPPMNLEVADPPPAEAVAIVEPAPPLSPTAGTPSREGIVLGPRAYVEAPETWHSLPSDSATSPLLSEEERYPEPYDPETGFPFPEVSTKHRKFRPLSRIINRDDKIEEVRPVQSDTNAYPYREDYRPVPDEEPEKRIGLFKRKPQESPTAPLPSGYISYVVQPFDTLSSIANAHSLTVADIQKINGAERAIRGETLILPIGASAIANGHHLP